MNGFLYEIYLTDLIFKEGFGIEECAVRIHDFGETSSVQFSDMLRSVYVFFKYAFGKRRRMFKGSCKAKVPVPNFRNLLIVLGILLSITIVTPIIQAVGASQELYILQVKEKIGQEVTSEPIKNVVQPYGPKKSHPVWH